MLRNILIVLTATVLSGAPGARHKRHRRAHAPAVHAPQVDLPFEPPVESLNAESLNPMAGLSRPNPAATPAPFTSLSSLTSSSAVERIHAVADRLIGTPYRRSGTDDRGFDCSGFVLNVVHSVGAFIHGRSSQDYWKQGSPVNLESLQAGDLVFFSNHSKSIGHVGIYLNAGQFIHASPIRGVTISLLGGAWFQQHYKGARRIPSLDEALKPTKPETPPVVPSKS